MTFPVDVWILKGVNTGKHATVGSLSVKVDGATTSHTYGPSSLSLSPPVPARAYGDSSPANQLIVNPVVHPDSAKFVASALAYGGPARLTAGLAGTKGDYGHPVFYGKAGDPVYKLHATEPWGTSPAEGALVPIPKGAMPAAGYDVTYADGDHHMAIVYNGVEYGLWRSDAPSGNGGTLNFAWGGKIPADGDGLGLTAESPGSTAADFGALFGVITPQDFESGVIPHALFIVLRNTASSFVWPAAKSDGHTTGGVPMGSRFQLMMSDAEIAALNAPAWKKAILTALAHYGGYVGDSGGPGFGFQLQSGQSWTSFGQPDPFVTYAKNHGISVDSGGIARFELGTDVDWASRLRVIAPPAH